MAAWRAERHRVARVVPRVHQRELLPVLGDDARLVRVGRAPVQRRIVLRPDIVTARQREPHSQPAGRDQTRRDPHRQRVARGVRNRDYFDALTGQPEPAREHTAPQIDCLLDFTQVVTGQPGAARPSEFEADLRQRLHVRILPQPAAGFAALVRRIDHRPAPPP